MKISKRKISKENLEHAAKILKVIAHPVKLEILEILEEEEDINVSTLCSQLGMGCDISMLSHHLAKMKDNGILHSTKKGKEVYYTLADKQILKIFDCIENCNF